MPIIVLIVYSCQLVLRKKKNRTTYRRGRRLRRTAARHLLDGEASEAAEDEWSGGDGRSGGRGSSEAFSGCRCGVGEALRGCRCGVGEALRSRLTRVALDFDDVVVPNALGARHDVEIGVAGLGRGGRGGRVCDATVSAIGGKNN